MQRTFCGANALRNCGTITSMITQSPPLAHFTGWGNHSFSNPTSFSALFAPPSSGLYVLMAPDFNWGPKPYRPLYFGQAENLFKRVSQSHEKYASWVREAGSAANLYVGFHYMQGSTEHDRRSREAELIRHYNPPCNENFTDFLGSLSAIARVSGERALQAPSPNYLSTLAGLVALAPPSRRYALFISHAWDYKDEYQRVVDLLNADASFRWENVSVPHDEPLPNLPALPKSDRYLVRQLDERIAKADCLLVLAGMYCAHRGWIQSEVEAAKDFNKPIIAVQPRGQERFPEVVRQAADEIVGWIGASIIGAVRKVVPDSSLSNLSTLANLAK